MEREEFIKKYEAIVERTLIFQEKSRCEGLLSLIDLIDERKYSQRDIFEYGIILTTKSVNTKIINKILTNNIDLEVNEDVKILKNVQKEAVIGIQKGYNKELLILLLNSYVNIDVEKTMTMCKNIEPGFFMEYE